MVVVSAARLGKRHPTDAWVGTNTLFARAGLYIWRISHRERALVLILASSLLSNRAAFRRVNCRTFSRQVTRRHGLFSGSDPSSTNHFPTDNFRSKRLTSFISK